MEELAVGLFRSSKFDAVLLSSYPGRWPMSLYMREGLVEEPCFRSRRDAFFDPNILAHIPFESTRSCGCPVAYVV